MSAGSSRGFLRLLKTATAALGFMVGAQNCAPIEPAFKLAARPELRGRTEELGTERGGDASNGAATNSEVPDPSTRPTTSPKRGRLIGFENLGSVSGFEVQVGRMLTCNGLRAKTVHEYTIYSIKYETIDLAGQAITASGLLLVPIGMDEPLPLLSYQHGTAVGRKEVPSHLSPEAQVIGYCFASVGYVTAMSDYLGLGNSPGYHPYHHAATEASAAVDLLRATREASGKLGFRLSADLFLAGYSQGGHATFSLQKNLEETLRDEFHLTASAPMAGAYDPVSTFASLLLSPSEHTTTELGYFAYALNRVYQTLNSYDEFVVAKYAGQLDQLFSGLYGILDVVNALPSDPKALFQPAFQQAILAKDVTHPLLKRIHQNRLNDWKPVTPTRLCHGRNDLEVPFFNSEETAKRMSAMGAPVQLVEIPGQDHAGAAPHCFENALNWFESLRQ